MACTPRRTGCVLAEPGMCCIVVWGIDLTLASVLMLCVCSGGERAEKQMKRVVEGREKGPLTPHNG